VPEDGGTVSVAAAVELPVSFGLVAVSEGGTADSAPLELFNFFYLFVEKIALAVEMSAAISSLSDFANNCSYYSSY